MSSSIALHTHLHWAARALQVVAEGRATHQALGTVPAAHRPAVQALLFHALRHWGSSQAWVAHLSQGRVKPRVKQLLCVALALLERPEDGVRYDAHTVVNQTVQACKQDPKTQAAAGLINACLRRYGRDQAAMRAQVLSDGLAQHNHQAWWLARIQAQYPEHWSALVAADLRSAPMVVRVNRRHHNVLSYQALLTQAGLTSTPVGAEGLVLDKAVPVERLPGFGQGWVSVQDASAQMAAHWVWDSPHLQAWTGSERPKILDACAAPGGKTAHLLELGDAQVTALDVDAQRLQRVRDNLQRLRLDARLCAADAAQSGDWQTEGPFDAILLDAPCSASGIARRHPDVLWLRRASDMDALVHTQATLLDRLWPQLKPGGRLVYATCSVFHEEGEAQATAFAQRTPDAKRSPASGHWLPQRVNDAQAAALGHNVTMAYDGFFYAVFDKI